MKSPLAWFLVVLGVALWLGGQTADYHFRDEATKLTEADIESPGYQGGGRNVSKIYHSHLADTRGEGIFFNFVTYAGLFLACSSGQLARKIQGKRRISAVPPGLEADQIATRR